MSIDRPTKEEMQALIDLDDFIRGRRSRGPKLAILWQCEKAGWVQAVPSGHADFVFFSAYDLTPTGQKLVAEFRAI
jgi:hypothetical protein